VLPINDIQVWKRFEDTPFKSVETPVANNPLEATAREPPKSTILAMVPPWRMLRRFCMLDQYERSAEGLVERKYGMVFFNWEFEVYDSWACCCYAELVERKVLAKPRRTWNGDFGFVILSLHASFR
jgi:hypothetical protein